MAGKHGMGCQWWITAKSMSRGSESQFRARSQEQAGSPVPAVDNICGMNSSSTEAGLKHDLRRLFRSMDFVSQHPALKREGWEAERFAEIYQQLGLAWEFLGMQCRHRSGWRKNHDGKFVCKVCGLIRGAK